MNNIFNHSSRIFQSGGHVEIWIVQSKFLIIFFLTIFIVFNYVILSYVYFQSELVFPKLPLQRKTTEFKGYKFEQYDYNGWVYNLMPGKYYIVLATSPIGKTAVKDTQFMFRIRGPAQNGQPLYKWEEI